MSFFAYLRERVDKSLWMIPASMGVATLFVVICLIRFEEAGWLFLAKPMHPGSISTTLSTLLAAILTIFGILFPITFSMLLRASSQFTPMILQVYRASVHLKLFLGLVFSTTLYLIALLWAFDIFGFSAFVGPALIGGFLLIILTVYSIPAFFDRFVLSLEPTYLAAFITARLKGILKTLEQPEETEESIALDCKQDRSRLKGELYRYRVQAPQSGYIQSIDFDKLLKLLEKHQLVGAVPVRSGDFQLEGEAICYLNGKRAPEESLKEKLAACFRMGIKRMEISDLELQLDELVSIIARALSPGVTDLATARQGINYVGSLCALVVNRRFDSGVRLDSKEEERLYSKEFDFYGLIHAAFDRIRQNSSSQPAVSLQLLEIICQLLRGCRSKARRELLKEVAGQIKEEVQDRLNSFDSREMKSRLEEIFKAVTA